MNKRKHILLVCILALAMLTATSGVALFTSATPTEGWSAVSVESEYAYKSVFEVEDRTYTVGTNAYKASALLYYPDGSATAESSVKLDQVGTYTLRYSVSAGDKVYAESKSFVVNYPHYDVSSAKSSVSYAIPDRATNKGVIAKIAQNDSLVFTQYIDFTKIASTDNLVKGYVVPDVAGANDFTELVFTFTDSEDSSVYFKVHFYAYDWTYNTYVAANGQNQNPMGVHQSQGLKDNDGYGLWSYISFKSSVGSSVVAPDASQFYINMNYDEKKVYTMGYPDQKSEIIDLDDTTKFKSAWTGFPSGKARLSIDAYNYTGATATVCITEVYGIEDLGNNKFIDTDKPVLTVNDEYGGTMPPALKGYSYAIPEASAYDAYAYDCDVKTSVWYNYGMENSVEVQVKDGKFVTDKVGTYGILYEAYDKVGNGTKEVRYVFAHSKIDDVTFDIPAEAARTAKTGEWVEIFDIDENGISGGSGKKTITEFVEFNGKRTEAFGGFRATETGVYKVIYIATDYVGKPTEKSYEVTVTANNKPVLEKDFDFYPTYISGGEYELPSYYAYLTKNGKITKTLCDIRVEDGTGSKNYKAGDIVELSVNNNGDKIKFTVTADGESLVSHEAVGVLAWVQEDAGLRFHVENYIVGSGFVSEKRSDGLVLSAGADNSMSFVFANALSSRHLTTSFGDLKGVTDSARVKVTIFDAVENSDSLFMVFGGNSSSAYVEIEDVRYSLSDTAFDGGTFDVEYTNNALNICGKQITLKSFEGFKREKVFLAVEYSGFGSNAAMRFISVANCAFNTVQTDRIAPMIIASHEAGGVRNIGTEYTLYTPIAYDVYSPNLEYGLTVTAPDGSFVKAKNGVVLNNADPTVDYVITLDSIGEYKIVYDLAEAKWFVSRQNVTSLGYTLIVADELAPEITWKNAIPTELNVDDMFILPEYTVSDNYSSAENIIVCVFVETPVGQLLMLPGNSLKMTHVGEYQVRVMVVDEAGNILNYVARINVKRA